jgi:hypothetical protein
MTEDINVLASINILPMGTGVSTRGTVPDYPCAASHNLVIARLAVPVHAGTGLLWSIRKLEYAQPVK